MMDKLKKLANGYISVIASTVFTICAIVYFKSIKGLEEVAGLEEVFKFMLTEPKDYFLCLLCGGLAKLIFVLVFIIAIISAICLYSSYREYKYDYEEIETKEILKYIANILLAIVVGIFQKKIIINFWLLVIVFIIAIFLVKFLVENL